MGAAELHEPDERGADEGYGLDGIATTGRSRALAIAPDSVVVRRDARVLGAVGLLAGAMAVAYAVRAATGGAVTDGLLALALGLLAAPYVWGVVDARTPLLVADVHGVRLRLGSTWRGLTWGALERVEHVPSPGVLRDGRLILVPRQRARALAGLDRRGRLRVRVSGLLYGDALALPLGLTTRTTHDDADLTEALSDLAAGATLVVEPLGLLDVLDDEPDEPDDLGVDEADDESPVAVGAVVTPVTPTPLPLRDTVLARRTEVVLPVDGEVEDADAAPGQLRRPGSVNLVEDTQAWGDRVRPIATPGPSVEPLVIDDLAPEPAPDPVIGPELAAARTRLGLDVDGLAERTRIRPHVIEAIEVDDFEACGGDFYARGHLRTLARVLGVDAVPLVARYDERYADAPIDARAVFEAERGSGLGSGLAAGGSIRGTRGGPNWSVLVAAVMALVLAWSIARLVMESPVELRTEPALNGSAGPGNGVRLAGPTVPVLLRAAGGGASVEVRDGTGKVVFTGDIAYGQTRALEISPPVRVSSSDGSVEVVVDGQEKGPLGETGQESSSTFVVR